MPPIAIRGQQERESWQASLWGQMESQGRRALARRLLQPDLGLLIPSVPLPWWFPHPDLQTRPRRQPAPQFPPPVVRTSIPECTALHLRPETSYLYLSRKGARAPSIAASFPLLAVLITSSAGCCLPPLAEATGNNSTCAHTKHPRGT